ncbi:MAG: capsule biosynthesis protein, partial [Pseudomonadota bacterium]
MTTKPKAKKFRIKRSSPAGGFLRGASTSRDGADAGTEPADAAAPPDVSRPAPPERPATRSSSAPLEGQPATSPSQQTTAGEVTSARMAGAEAAIDEIRREGLTGRQLRMARRVAQKHNLPATSDFDAVRLLRAQGIDPFKPTNMLELVVPKAGAEQHEGGAPDAFENLPAQPGGAGSGRVQLPQTVPVKQNLPSTDLSPSDRRQKEISEIQRDIARRRRRNLAALLARLSFFVFLPTAVAAWYFYSAATPMYSTKSEFLILQADNVGGSGLGGLLSGTQFATNQDSIAVQSFLQSKEVMLRLDEEVGYKTHFTQSWIDPIARLSPDATNEETYKVYKKRVKIGYDPTEGVIRMEVIAADPEVSAEFSRRLISYAEARVNDLSQQKRGDQMQDALESFQKAEVDRRAAQQSLVELQQQGAILDPEAVIVGLRGQINTLETQL